MGNPGRAVSLHLARSGSQSEHRIRRILPARGACHIIRKVIDIIPVIQMKVSSLVHDIRLATYLVNNSFFLFFVLFCFFRKHNCAGKETSCL